MTTETSPSALPAQGGNGYLARLWDARHFLLHLAGAELRARFRRSYAGIAWAALQPMAFSFVITFALHTLADKDFVTYFLYVFSGLMLWEVVTGAVNQGAVALPNSAGYIKQVHLPITLYFIKSLLALLAVFGCAALGFMLTALLLMPSAFSITWLALPLIPVLLALLGLPVMVLSGLGSLVYRDWQQMQILGLQMLWFVSPVFIPRSVYDQPGLAALTGINPIAALLDAWREPLLYHQWPALQDLGLLLLWVGGLWLAMLWRLKAKESKVVFYL